MSETDATTGVDGAGQQPDSCKGGADAVGSTRLQLERMLADMEELGIVTELAGRVVGGVAVSASYHQHVLATEGRTEQVPPCQLLITRHRRQELLLIPATQAELEQGDAGLPRESPVLSKMVSPAALTDLRWSRVPAVVIFGCFVADEEELEEAAAAGVPVSPSLAGPHAEEQMTQMEVFFRQYCYPEHKCFILRDWGFMVCGHDLPDAMASFDERLKETLVSATEGGDILGSAGEQAASRASARCSATDHAGAAPAGTGDGAKAPMAAVLSHAFKRLQEKVGLVRTQSEPAPELAGAAGVAGWTRSPKAGDGLVGSRSGRFQGLSEPSTPMFGSAPSEATLPDNIRTISTATRRMSSEFRVPSVQAGLRPW